MDALSRSRLHEIARELEELAAKTSAVVPRAAASVVDPGFLKSLLGLHQCRDTDHVAQTMARLASNYAAGERCFVMLVTDDRRLKFAAGENITQSQLSGGVPVARAVIQSALARSEIVADDYHGRSVICVPVIGFPSHNGEIAQKLGLLYVDRGQQAPPVSEAVLEMLEAIIDHGATAIANHGGSSRPSDGPDPAQLEELHAKVSELQNLKDNVSKLYEIGHEISSTLDLEALLIKIVDYVIELSEAQRGFIMLVEDGEPIFKVGRDSRQRDILPEYFKFSRSVTHKTIQAKQPQFLLMSSDDDFSPTRSMEAMELKSVMCVPLMEKDEVLGLIYLDSQHSVKEFDSADAELLQFLCGQAAVALLNAKLYYQVGEKQRITSELDLASKIQLELLPDRDPDVDGLEIHGSMIPAKEVGGDYYDFIEHVGTTRSMTITIGDVSGKGVGAGLVSIMARCIIRSAVFQVGVPHTTIDILRNLNTHFCNDLRKGMFMTVAICNWWAERNTISYVGAGHEHIIIYRAQDGRVETHRSGGVATGVIQRANKMYKEREYVLSEGDHVLLYTDGVTEAMNDRYEEWGLERLQLAMRIHGDKTPRNLINVINENIRTFVGVAEQHDDITMVAMKVKPRLFDGDMSGEMENLLDVFSD